MALKLSNLNTVPPGYFRYFVPETTTWLKDYTSIDDLEDAVINHYKVNAKPPPTKSELRGLIQDQMCHALPAGYCKDSNGLPWSSIVSGLMDFSTFKQGTATLVHWFLTGKQKVSREETIRRSEICASCQYNQQPQGCTSCNSQSVQDLVVKVVGGETTEWDSKLQGCAICKCALKVKTRIPLPLLQQHTSNEQLAQFPDYCWIKG